MIELSDGNIALSSCVIPFPIVIINTSLYQVKKEIQLERYIIERSSLCVFDDRSFIYAFNGRFLQISNKDGSIIFKSTGGKFSGYRGILPLEGGKYLVVSNFKRISIIKLC